MMKIKNVIFTRTFKIKTEAKIDATKTDIISYTCLLRANAWFSPRMSHLFN